MDGEISSNADEAAARAYWGDVIIGGDNPQASPMFTRLYLAIVDLARILVPLARTPEVLNGKGGTPDNLVKSPLLGQQVLKICKIFDISFWDGDEDPSARTQTMILLAHFKAHGLEYVWPSFLTRGELKKWLVSYIVAYPDHFHAMSNFALDRTRNVTLLDLLTEEPFTYTTIPRDCFPPENAEIKAQWEQKTAAPIQEAKDIIAAAKHNDMLKEQAKRTQEEEKYKISAGGPGSYQRNEEYTNHEEELRLAQLDLELAKEEQLRTVGGEYYDEYGKKRWAAGALDMMGSANW